MNIEDTKVTRGSNNIFADLGLPDADEHLLKARIALCIQKMIEDADITQSEAARRMQVSQSDVSNIIRGKFTQFSVDRMLTIVRRLGADVEVKLKPHADKEPKEGLLSLVVETMVA